MLFCNKNKSAFISNKTKYVINEKPTSAKNTCTIIEDQLLDEGNARQNLATFCQTFMEDEARNLLANTFEKNAIDKSEYPQTAEIENRCVNIIADLWNASGEEGYIGTSTVGSSEACILAGMAMKFRWRNFAKKAGFDINAKKPNIVISSAYQVCWEKFCVYFDIEMRTVPLDEEHLSLNTDVVMDYVDDYTIGIVGILGLTYTGAYDDIETLNKLVNEYNSKHKIPLVIHVDGASGGLFVPFTEPDLNWDFRLNNVVSISTSGHKYGLVYPGVGWVVWRDKEYLPEELIFEVSYLGGSMPTMAVNFSRSASQIIGQYYNFIRLGREGYQKVHNKTSEIAYKVSQYIKETGYFDILNDGSHLPVICYKLKANIKWTLFDLSDRLRMNGWQIPTYPLPSNLDETIVQRIVCRADFSVSLAQSLVNDFNKAIEELNNAHILFHEDKNKTYGFTH